MNNEHYIMALLKLEFSIYVVLALPMQEWKVKKNIKYPSIIHI